MTDEIETGGPAFPNSVQPDFQYAEAGMTLRDWFAGQALAGMCTGFTGARGDTDWFQAHGAVAAYSIADAMLAARKANTPEGDG